MAWEGWRTSRHPITDARGTVRLLSEPSSRHSPGTER